MGKTIIGHCPKCGAPIYTDTIWHSTTPPPNYFTCSCTAEYRNYYTINTSSSENVCNTKIRLED